MSRDAASFSRVADAIDRYGEFVPVVPLDPDDNPYDSSLRALRHPTEFYERGLWEIAQAAGNVSKACASLHAQGHAEYMPTTMREWITGRFRNRYQAICRGAVAHLEALRATDADMVAARAAGVELEALDQIVKTLSATNAVEASMVLRNVSQSKKVQEENAALLRGKSAGQLQARGLTEVAAALARLGVIEVIEGSVEDAQVLP